MAAVFCPHPKNCRLGVREEKIIDEQNFAEKKNGAELVCDKKMVVVRTDLRTISLIIPNTIHGCKKRNIGRL